jgi:hypothetical protein
MNDANLFSGAFVAEDAATVAAVMLPHSKREGQLTAVALLHVCVVFPLSTGLSRQLHLAEKN